MISDRFRVSAGAAKKCFALAAFSAALALPAFGEISETLYYDGGDTTFWDTFHTYNWGHTATWKDRLYFGNETIIGTTPEVDTRFVFAETAGPNGSGGEVEDKVVEILNDVTPGEVVIESGDYTFTVMQWGNIHGVDIVDHYADGTIAGSGSLTVNAGASLMMYIDNSYTGDTVVAGTLSTDVHPDSEDSDYGSGHHAFGTGALRVESTGTVNLNGTVQSNSAAEIAGTLNLGKNKSGAEAAYNPFAEAKEAVSLVSGGTLDLGGNANVTMPLAVFGGTIAHGTLSGKVDVALAHDADLKLDGATLSQTVSGLKLSDGSAVSLENGASLSVNGLVVEVSSVDAAAITLSGNSALTLDGSLQLNIDDALLAELLENQGTASVQVVSVADAGDSGAADCIKGTFASVPERSACFTRRAGVRVPAAWRRPDGVSASLTRVFPFSRGNARPRAARFFFLFFRRGTMRSSRRFFSSFFPFFHFPSRPWNSTTVFISGLPDTVGLRTVAGRCVSTGGALRRRLPFSSRCRIWLSARCCCGGIAPCASSRTRSMRKCCFIRFRRTCGARGARRTPTR